MRPIVFTVARPFFRFWESTFGAPSRAQAHPSTRPTIEFEGPSPDRVLVIGDGFSVDSGVLFHELGLAGRLARRLSALSSRGVHIDIVTRAGMTAASAVELADDIRMLDYDVVLLCLGATEARTLEPVALWKRDFAGVLESIRSEAPAVPIVVVDLPLERICRELPSPIARFVSRQIPLLNRATIAVCDGRPGVRIVDLERARPHDRDLGFSADFDSFAAVIAPTVHEALLV